MEMTIKEFKEKIEKTDNLVFIKRNGYYFWQIKKGQNEDVKDYIVEQLSQNLVLTDAYLVQEPNKCNVWIPKTEIERITQHIINAENYEEINPQSPFIKKTEIIKKDDIFQQVRIYFERNDTAQTAKRCLIEMLEENKEIDVKIYTDELTISRKDIDEEVRYRRKCETDKAIAKFNEIFGL